MYPINTEEHKCYLCGSQEYEVIAPRVRDSKDIQVLKCIHCDLVFLSQTDYIADDFYEKSGMLNYNVNLDEYRKNSYKDDKRRFSSLQEKIKNKKILDFGCGAGGFLHMASRLSAECSGIELDNYIRAYLNKEGLRCYKNLEEVKDKKYDVITMFHVLEHLEKPKDTLKKIKDLLMPEGTLIIEVPNADDALLKFYKSKEFAAFTYWSCHIMLYNATTLKKLIKCVGESEVSVKQIQRYPLSNHLYWLSQQKPAGHIKWGALSDTDLDIAYEKVLGSLGMCDTIFAEITFK